MFCISWNKIECNIRLKQLQFADAFAFAQFYLLGIFAIGILCDMQFLFCIIPGKCIFCYNYVTTTSSKLEDFQTRKKFAKRIRVPLSLWWCNLSYKNHQYFRHFLEVLLNSIKKHFGRLWQELLMQYRFLKDLCTRQFLSILQITFYIIRILQSYNVPSNRLRFNIWLTYIPILLIIYSSPLNHSIIEARQSDSWHFLYSYVCGLLDITYGIRFLGVWKV